MLNLAFAFVQVELAWGLFASNNNNLFSIESIFVLSANDVKPSHVFNENIAPLFLNV